jgi:hypothetical protein
VQYKTGVDLARERGETVTWAHYAEAREEAERREQQTYDAVTDRRLLAILDVLAPRMDLPSRPRSPIFEWGHETTPTAEEMIKLGEEILNSLRQL